MRKTILIISSLLISITKGQNSASYDSNSAAIYGNDNCAFGDSSLNSFVANTGPFNTATGYFALHKNTSGEQNVANGSQSLFHNTTGNHNTAIGYKTLYFNCLSNNGGDENTMVGYQAGYSNDWGHHNTAVGSEALFSNVSGNFNTANGFQSLYNTGPTVGQQGDANTANGYKSLFGNVNGSNNTADGGMALFGNYSGSENTAIGFKSLYNNSDISNYYHGYGNTSIGCYAMHDNQDGDYNTAVGKNSLHNNTLANWNVSFGADALYSNTTGTYNVAVGYRSLYSNSVGFFNVAVGSYALASAAASESCTAIGTSALFHNTGNENTAIGFSAGSFTQTANRITILGAYGDIHPINTNYNSTSIGYGAIVNSNNCIQLGNNNIMMIESTMGTIMTSDGRFKFNINYKEVVGLDFIQKLRPVVYNFNMQSFNDFRTKLIPDSIKKHQLITNFDKISNIRQSGFIAQEVELAAKECGYNFNGISIPSNEYENYGLAYSLFVVPLVKSVQEQQKLIESELKILNRSKQTYFSLQSELDSDFQDDQMELSTIISYSKDAIGNLIIKCSFLNELDDVALNIYNEEGVELVSNTMKKNLNSEILIKPGSLSNGIYSLLVLAAGKIIGKTELLINN